MQNLVIDHSDDHRQSEGLQSARSAQTPRVDHALVCTSSDQTHPNSGSVEGSPR